MLSMTSSVYRATIAPTQKKITKQKTPPLQSRKSFISGVLLLALLYFTFGQLSFAITSENLIVTIVIFASEGISLAALLILGRRFWPGIFLGQLVLALSSGIPLIPALLIAMVNSAGSVLGVTLFYSFKLNKALPSIKDIFGLLAIIAFIIQPLSSITGTSILLFSSIISPEHYLKSIFSWWFGNIMGQFLLTPMILLVYENWKKIQSRELILIGLFFSLLSYLIFIAFPILSLALVFSITMPLMILVSAFRSITHAMMVTTINAFIALYATYIGVGPFANSDIINNIIDLNFYILSHILLLLTIGTLFCEQKRNEKKLRALALYDTLTGLPNRNLLKEQMNHAIAMAHRFKIRSAVCYIDIDGFKQVNDTFGHNAGDQVIKTVATRIKQHIQEDDSLIRLGGDEFLLIAMDMRTDKRIKDLLKRICSSVNKPIYINNQEALVSLSIGIATCPTESDSLSQLITSADSAMYQAKSKGKNQFVFFKDINKAQAKTQSDDKEQLLPA